MSKICMNCKAVLADDVTFCTECGTSFPADTPASISQSIPFTAAPETKVVGTGAFFGLRFLFGIPIIGWIICLIMTFAPKNKNIKNYARATLIWILMSVAFSVLGYFVLRWVYGLVMDYINEMMNSFNNMFDGQLGDLQNLMEQLNGLEDLTGQLNGLEDLTGQLNGLENLTGQLNGLENLTGQLESLEDITNQLNQLEESGVIPSMN